MAEDSESTVPSTPAPTPANYQSKQAKVRFAISKFYGMGSGGQWTAQEIADELDVAIRTVYKYLNDSQMGEEAKQILATTQAEWRLDMALSLRKEIKRLEQAEQELLQAKDVVATDFEEKTVTGTPTGDRNISLADDSNQYRLKIPVPTEYETVTDYGPDLERIQEQKRKYWKQIAKLLGLDSQEEIDQTLTQRHEEVKIVEFRDADGDDYPEQDVIDVDGSTAQIDQADEGDTQDNDYSDND